MITSGTVSFTEITAESVGINDLEIVFHHTLFLSLE